MSTTISRAEPSQSPTLHGGDLFRAEVLAERNSEWLGTVVVTPARTHLLFSLFAAIALAGLVALLLFGEYTRKARLNGWLVPQNGLMRVFAPQPGVVQQLHVREGAIVTKGAPLIVISTELRTEAMGPIREETVRTLRQRLESTEAEKDRVRQLYDKQQRDLSDRLASKESEAKHLEDEIQLQRQRYEFAARNLTRQRELLERQLVVEKRLQEAEQDQLDQAVKLQDLRRSRETLAQDRIALDTQLRQMPIKRQQQLAEIDRNLAALQQQLAEAEARREIVITAPQDGTVTAVQAEPGSTINTGAPLLSILPSGTRLQAQLFGRSGAVGFVQPGQRVLLRYAAFPYQKFGAYEGTVHEVSRAAISPSEFSQRLSGLTALHGENEPVYEITVQLKSQSAIAYGRAVPLQPGMELEADVMMESRRLFEWVLDPVFSLTGKVNG